MCSVTFRYNPGNDGKREFIIFHYTTTPYSEDTKEESEDKRKTKVARGTKEATYGGRECHPKRVKRRDVSEALNVT